MGWKSPGACLQSVFSVSRCSPLPAGLGQPGAGYLLHDEAGQDVHDEAPQAGVHGQRLDDGPHEQHGQGALLHQLLHHHGQHLRCVHVPFRKAQVGGCEEAESGPVLFAQLPRKGGSPATLKESLSPINLPP